MSERADEMPELGSGHARWQESREGLAGRPSSSLVTVPSVRLGTGRLSVGLVVVAAWLSGCAEDSPGLATSMQRAEEIYAPLGDPLPDATAEQLEAFERGLAVARRTFTPKDGLGPMFNVVSCASCHEKPVTGGAAGRYRNFLLGGQELSDGSFSLTGINGVQTHYSLTEGRVQDAPDTNRRALRNPIPFFGVGLIAEVGEEEILRHADPEDRDGDGISGRPNYDSGFVGRFGRKAQTVSIEGFIRGPFFNHIGITSDPLPDDLRAALPVPSVSEIRKETPGTNLADTLVDLPHAQTAAPSAPIVDDDGVPDPELSDDDLFALVSFTMLLAAPEPEPLSEQAEDGRAAFSEVGCDACHVRMLASPRGGLPLYSDLLLHDMGEGLADQIRMGEASGREFRTQPLWGIAPVGPYLHDGRADTLHEAIRMHGGEAEASREAYLALQDERREHLVEFLEHLGGRAQQSAGLLPPGTPVPEVGELGAPTRELDADELERFVSGREVFDREMTVAGGLGTTFNGDSCRACHFQPMLGGAGPADVDVVRQGIHTEDGMFVEPAGGTMVHRHSLDPQRPMPDSQASSFELRQTPPLFGLGLLDQVPAETILELADPDDDDGDGIRGIAQMLPDGRLGRFGWKADVPSVAEFARDGLTNELGITVGDAPGLTFGVPEDDDGSGDPELSEDEIAALTFFMFELGPPPRKHDDRELEGRGEELFRDIGCAGCHVPELSTADGRPVRAYTDLLLHQVMPPDYLGIVVGAASQRAFRTPPLWGVSDSSPYLHDGRASTLEEAIADHHGEAAPSAEGFEMLTADERDAVLSFLDSL